MTGKKVALVHDYIKEYGGAERVLEQLHEMYPQAPVFTLVYAPQFLGPHKERFKDWDIRPSFLQLIPFSYKFISLYRIIAPLVFKTFRFAGFDIILVSATGAYSPNSINKQSAKQLCYYHTPPRYLYGYATARQKSTNPILRALTEVMLHILRIVDYYSSKNVDVCIANSENVARRIEKAYRRKSVVVYPPVAVPAIQLQQVHKNYFLAGGRLARPKHIDLIVKTCSELNVPLKVFGKSFAGYGEEVKQVAGSSVEFLGEVSDEQRNELMRSAKAFIFAAEDEDFGIVPVEAMAQGTPVIAFASGGVLETVVDGKTGVLFEALTVESLKKAIKKFESLKISSHACYNQAKRFSRETFHKQIEKLIYYARIT
ncbi:MAG: glycosyltransferase [Patescibacteria group bacterium]|nr:glycosyltransferase [Patescibacteria group bacterium]